MAGNGVTGFRLQDRVPQRLKVATRPLVRLAGDTRDRYQGVPFPPWSLRSKVPGDFRAVGQEFLDYMVRYGGLRPSDHVLDIGFRAGRMAIPLTGYLGTDARYEGVDDWEEGTAWCQSSLTPRHPNFRFHQLEMAVSDTRVVQGADSLPYDEGTFDFVLLGSILQLSPASFHYFVAEAARVLRTGGTYFGTWFLRNDGHAGGQGSAPAIACTEDQARTELESLGLVVEAVHRGGWDGCDPSLSYQDLVIARKVP